MPRRCRGIGGDAHIAPYGRTRGAVFGRTESSGPTEEYMRCGGVTAEREVRGGERCFEQVLRCFFVRCAKFGGETQNGVDIGVGECHN